MSAFSDSYVSRVLLATPTRVRGLDAAARRFSANYSALYERSAFCVDKILKGAKPANRPVEQPTNFQVVVYMKRRKRSA